MRHRIGFGLGIACLLLLVMGSSAAAKTALTSTTVPEETTAGEPFLVGFTLENHEGQLRGDETFKVVATSLSSGETLAFEALPGNGSWSAEVTLPTSGTWFLNVANEDLGFQQDLAAVFAEEAFVAPVTSVQLTSAIREAQTSITADPEADYGARLAAVEADVTGLQLTIADLTSQRDALQAENEALQSHIDNTTSINLWLVATFGAAVGIATVACGFIVANRRGISKAKPRVITGGVTTP